MTEITKPSLTDCIWLSTITSTEFSQGRPKVTLLFSSCSSTTDDNIHSLWHHLAERTGFLVIRLDLYSFSAPNTFETRTVTRGRKPQSIYVLQLIGTWIVASLRQVNNKITRPKHILKQDLLLFLWSNQLATEQEKVATSTTSWNTQLPFMSQSTPVLAAKGAHTCSANTQVLQTATEAPWSCNVASNLCQWRREWIQISCDLYAITNSYCFSSTGFVNLSQITFYFVVHFVPSKFYLDL